MLDHRMALDADLAGDLDALLARLHARERDACARDELLDALQSPKKVEVPPRSAEFAVGDRLQAGFLLPLDDALDFAVLHGLERRSGKSSLGTLVARFLERLRSKQATDMVRAERRFAAFHRHPPMSSRYGARLRRKARASLV